MPPKPKLYKSTGKAQLKGNSANSMSSNSISMTPEQEQQFQIELYWCIQQLQTALASGKLNNKQVQEHTKALNTLMNNSTSIVQKRQVMRLSFGNYREKIAAAEERASKNIANIKLKPAKQDKKSMFLKKSMTLSHGKHDFKFNFDEPLEEEPQKNADVENNFVSDLHTIQQNNKCHYIPSDNTFKFNFELSEVES